MPDFTQAPVTPMTVEERDAMMGARLAEPSADEPAAKSARIAAIWVDSVIGPSSRDNFDVSEETFDGREIDEARRAEFINDEFAYLRAAGPTKGGANDVVPWQTAREMMEADPEHVHLDCRWVHTAEKSRLTTRQFNT